MGIKKLGLSLLFFLMLLSVITVAEEETTAVFWGAFDPPTVAHLAIIAKSVEEDNFHRLIVIVNNHSYKQYIHPLAVRLKLLQDLIAKERLSSVEILWQDDISKIDYSLLKQSIEGPLCVIAGYDSYMNFVNHSTVEERLLYDKMAMVPRGSASPILFDENAFLLPIDPIYKDVSSTQMRAWDYNSLFNLS